MRSLKLSLSMDGVEVSKKYSLPTDFAIKNKKELAEALATSISHGFVNKPEMIEAMIALLLDGVEQAGRKGHK